MKKLLLISAFLLVFLTAAAQERDFSSLDSLLTVYCTAMQEETLESKQLECDFLIGSCKDTATMEHVARKLFDHYAASNVMGEEALAIYVYDKWFADGTLSIGGEYVKMEADIFVMFNRSSLIGMDAPVLEMNGADCRKVRIPSVGRTSILFFFDTSCSKCRIYMDLLPQALSDVDFPVDFYAVYCGPDSQAWEEFRQEFDLGNPAINLIHAWDPELDTDYQRLYSVISTPRVFVVEPQGTIIGRRLEPDSLKELMVYAGAIQKVFDDFNKCEQYETK